MPHDASGSGGSDDFASTDEVKVYKDEGEEEKRSSDENLSEDKLGLVTETELEGKSSDVEGSSGFSSDNNANGGTIGGGGGGGGNGVVGPRGGGGGGEGGGVKLPEFNLHDHLPFGYPLISPPSSYPYTNGSTHLASPSKIFPPHPGLGFFVYGSDPISHPPPPAHMGIPPLHIDYKTGLSRPPIYGIGPGPGQLPHPLYRPEFPPWNGSTGSFHGPYPPSLSQSPLSWFPPPGIFSSHPGISSHHPAILASRSTQDLSPVSDQSRRMTSFSSFQAEKKRNYIKKPLNAFMLFMKEMRQKVIEECTLKESAAINQILGRKWHALERSEQAKYYEMARKEKELHMQLYPGWSARDNYATHTKKKKLKREHHDHHDDRSTDFENHEEGLANAKKLRTIYDQEQQSNWCNSYKSESESAGENSLSNTVTNDGCSSFGPFSLTASSNAHSQLSL